MNLLQLPFFLSFYVAAYGEDLATEAEFLKILTILDTNSFQVQISYLVKMSL